jgi:CheY-like chemotaxis protein
MMTNVATTPPAVVREPEDLETTATQKVVIVNGSTEILDLLETVLDAGHYDVVFVESSEHAYSQIKRVQPNLVILCVNIDDLNSFQVLSMLKLDPATRTIPVLTHTTDGEDADEEEEATEGSEAELFAPKPATVRMN